MMYLNFLVCFLLIIIKESTCRLEEDTINNTTVEKCEINQCFHRSAEYCPKPDNKCRCHQLPNCKKAAVCCNVSSFQLTEGLACANISNGFVEALHVRNATLDTLNLNLPAWRSLKFMSITDGKIDSVEGDFKKLSFVSCLNLSSNGITKFEERSLVYLYNLKALDLSHNNLSDIPRFKKEGKVSLDISDNKAMLCTSVFDALRSEIHFVNEKNTTCMSSKTFHWFNTTEFIPLLQVIGLHELKKDCNQNCLCEPDRVDFVPGKPPIFAVRVDCSGKNLTDLPTPLPPNTISLNISNNFIKSLDLIGTDASYEHLRVLFADNNQITSISFLEGSKFKSNFVALSLRNNKLRSLPTYILSNIFDRNYNSRQIHLGLNKLQCDCYYAKTIREWLITKQKQIPDYDELFCDNMMMRVIDLNPSKMCQSQQDWTDYIYYIITLEVLLLVGLIAKVFYDYWVFKTAGYLPWPASKMPKLPCDWLCE